MVGHEVLGVKRRRRWSIAEKRQIMAEAFSSSEGVSFVARRRGLYPQQIYRWRRDLADTGVCEIPALQFLPVSIAEVDVSAPVVETLRLEIGCLGGRALRIDGSVSDARLQCLIRLVETA